MKLDGMALARGLAACAPAFKQFGEACAELRRNMRLGYALAGRPYGDTDEGMMRWYAGVARDLQHLRPHSPAVSQPTS